MTLKKLFLAFCITICLFAALGWLLVYFHPLSLVQREEIKQSQPATQSSYPSHAVFSPPDPKDAPAEIRDAVLIGYNIMMDTQKYAGKYVGNTLSCRNCHFDGGRRLNTLSLVGVAAKYPIYRERRDYATDLTLRTQGCFERSMNGVAPAAESQIMQSLIAYYTWISKGIPVYSDIPWLGLKGPTLKDYTGNPEQGKTVYKNVCSRCHGENGEGTPIAPPLWGDNSYNDGAGMHKIKNFSEFSYRYMPKNAPVLSKEQAMDLAEFVHTQPRPHFVATHPNKIERVISLPGGEQ